MKRTRMLVIATAVAAALAGPSLAQTRGETIDDSNAYRSPTDGRAGGAGYRSETSGATPSTSSAYRSDDDFRWYHVVMPWKWDWDRLQSSTNRGHIARDNAYHSPTDGRAGGAGYQADNGAVPSTTPWVMNSEPYDRHDRIGAVPQYEQLAARDQGRVTERSPTDGRAGGAGVPSSASGAVPSTEPGEDRPATGVR